MGASSAGCGWSLAGGGVFCRQSIPSPEPSPSPPSCQRRLRKERGWGGPTWLTPSPSLLWKRLHNLVSFLCQFCHQNDFLHFAETKGASRPGWACGLGLGVLM